MTETPPEAPAAPAGNAIEQLRDMVAARHPGASQVVEAPLHDDGFWSLDIDEGETRISVQWSKARHGFGISDGEMFYGMGPDAMFGEIEKAARYISMIIGPPAEIVQALAVIRSQTATITAQAALLEACERRLNEPRLDWEKILTVHLTHVAADKGSCFLDSRERYPDLSEAEYAALALAIKNINETAAERNAKSEH